MPIIANENQTNHIMKNNSIIKLLLSVVAILCLSSFTNEKSIKNGYRDNDEILIRHRPSTPPTFPHSPSVVSISAYYDSDNTCIYASLSNAGVSVDVDICNLITGETDSYAVTGNGSSAFPISGNAGIWTITFTLSSGDVYEGSFII